MIQMRKTLLANKKRILGALALSISLILPLVFFFQFRTTAVPQIEIKVVDEVGKPVQGVRLRQFWYEYSYEGIVDQWSGEEIRDSDEKGNCVFDEKEIEISVIIWLRSRLKIVKDTFPGPSILPDPHSSWGPDSMVLVMGGSADPVTFDDILKAHKRNETIVVRLRN